MSRGKSSFTLRGPDVDGSIGAECEFKERVVTVGVLTFDAKKLAYVCELEDGAGRAVGSLTLGEPKPAGMKERLLARATRRGLAVVDGVNVDIASMHHFAGSKLSSPAPTGYVLSVQSSSRTRTRRSSSTRRCARTRAAP